MFSVAFDKPVYGEGKYYQPLRASYHIDVNRTRTYLATAALTAAFFLSPIFRSTIQSGLAMKIDE